MSVTYAVKVGESRPETGKKPSAGPVFRYIYAKDGLLELPDGMHSPWEDSVERNPTNRMLGQRQTTDSKLMKLIKLYALDKNMLTELKIQFPFVFAATGVSILETDVVYTGLIVRNGSFPWSQAVTYVPLYDSLVKSITPFTFVAGADAVEFVVNHAEVSTAFVQENKLHDTMVIFFSCILFQVLIHNMFLKFDPGQILSCLPACCSYLKTIVSFANVSSTQKNEAEGLGVSLFSWKEFSELVNFFNFVVPLNNL
ncbi:hypothetical protein GQ457_18G020250 [Hibiscus cannabinus]